MDGQLVALLAIFCGLWLLGAPKALTIDHRLYQWYDYWAFPYHPSAYINNRFYHTMHYSAKRGIAIACLSACLSVTMVDQEHIGWKSWKLIARTISPTPSPFVAQNHPPTPRGTWEIWGRIEIGWEKVACWSTKAAISLKRVKIEEKLLWRTYRNSSTLFRTVKSPTPYGLLFPEIGSSQPPPKLQSLLFQERVKLYELQILYAHS